MNPTEIVEKKYADAVMGIKPEWFTDGSDAWHEYVANLPSHLQAVYLIVVLHNQVVNGGFHQYFTNVYGQFSDLTIKALMAIGDTKKAGLLSDALRIVNTNHLPFEQFRQKLLSRDMEALFISEELAAPLAALDKLYDEDDQDELLKMLGDYLKR